MADLAGSRVITEDELDSTTLALAIEEILGMLNLFPHFHSWKSGSGSHDYCTVMRSKFAFQIIIGSEFPRFLYTATRKYFVS